MAWLKLSITTTAEKAEEIADFLQLFDAEAISLSGISNEKIFGNPVKHSEQVLWQHTEVSGLLPKDIDMDILLICLRERVGSNAIFEHTIALIEDKNWEQNYKDSVSLQWIGERICICPSWLEPPQTVISPIILDPGLAFGTGTHATTRLCLEWLETLELEGRTIIDYGCGSGILALASAALGAKQVFAIDVDPQAIISTVSNAEKNHLDDKITAGLPEQISMPVASVLVANILLNPLTELSSTLAGLTESGGCIGLSGILATQIEECLASYSPWFSMNEPVIEQEWAFIDGVRK